MKNLIQRILGDGAQRRKDEKDDGTDAHVALCVLLLEAAHADGECSSEEMKHVVATLTSLCGIAPEDINELVDAAYRKRDNAVDLFSFTRYLNQNYSKEEKLGVMESVWRVIHIDGRLEAHEDHFAHKLSNLLRLTHREMIEAKKRARDQLA